MASEPVPDLVVSTHSEPIPDTVPSAGLIPDQVPSHESDLPFDSIPEEVSDALATNSNSTTAPSPDAEESSLTSLLLKSMEGMQEHSAALAKSCMDSHKQSWSRQPALSYHNLKNVRRKE